MMRISILGTVLLCLATGCTKSSAPTEESVAADTETDQGTEAAPDAETEVAEESDMEAAPEAETEVAADSDAEEAAPAEEFGIGVAAPNFENLIGTDDENHSLADYADAKAVALVFTCNHCPVAAAYEDRIVGLHSEYAEKGVQLVAVNVSNMEADKLPAMKELSEAKGFEFPYLYDPTQQIARDYGATVTPHIFLLDGNRKLAYVGAFDDNMSEEAVTEHYLRDAIDAVLAGNAPSTAETKPVGCGIAYE